MLGVLRDCALLGNGGLLFPSLSRDADESL